MVDVRLHQVYVRVPSGEQARWSAVAPEAAAAIAFGDIADLAPAERDLVAPPPAGTPALDHVDLVVRDGETLAVVGPSGCGKTTLLRVVAGLQPVEQGAVWMGERDVTQALPRDRGIGMVFQNYALYPQMESRANLGFFFKIRRRGGEIDARVREVAQVLGVGFDALLDRRPPRLSGGQQQRVAIGRCIIRDPSVFLFDEPLSNLDARLRQTTRVEIKRLLRRYAITAVYVTHDQSEAQSLGDRIAVMRRGKIEQIGSYQELHDDPITLFVATFLGTPPCNLLPGSIDGGVLTVGGTSLRGVTAARVHSGQVVVGIRPDAIALADDGRGSLAATVELVQRLPSVRIATVTLQVAGRSIVAQLDRELEFYPGDHLRIAIDPARVLLFEPEEGRRLRA